MRGVFAKGSRLAGATLLVSGIGLMVAAVVYVGGAAAACSGNTCLTNVSSLTPSVPAGSSVDNQVNLTINSSPAASQWVRFAIDPTSSATGGYDAGQSVVKCTDANGNVDASVNTFTPGTLIIDASYPTTVCPTTTTGASTSTTLPPCTPGTGPTVTVVFTITVT